MMNDPVKIEFTIPENCPKDIELMSMLVQAYKHCGGTLTNDQIKTALAWFKSYIAADLGWVE